MKYKNIFRLAKYSYITLIIKYQKENNNYLKNNIIYTWQGNQKTVICFLPERNGKKIKIIIGEKNND